MLETKQTAPNFQCLNQNEESVQLDELVGKQTIVLYFYPKDNTPGCSTEAVEFTELLAEFNQLNTTILGVSKDSIERHQGFIDKKNIGFDLLADTEGKLCEDYGVWQEKGSGANKKMGIVRSTFIINIEGELDYVEYGVKAKGHAQKILEHIQAM